MSLMAVTNCKCGSQNFVFWRPFFPELPELPENARTHSNARGGEPHCGGVCRRVARRYFVYEVARCARAGGRSCSPRRRRCGERSRVFPSPLDGSPSAPKKGLQKNKIWDPHLQPESAIMYLSLGSLFGDHPYVDHIYPAPEISRSNLLPWRADLAARRGRGPPSSSWPSWRSPPRRPSRPPGG